MLSAITNLTQRLESALLARDIKTIGQIFDETRTGPFRTTSLCAVELEPEVVAARRWFETWDRVLQTLAFGDDGDIEFGRAIMVPHVDGFSFGTLLVNAMWLQRLGSPLLDEAPEVPSDLSRRGLHDQIRVLGRTFVRTDARTPFDYHAVAESVHHSLIPGLMTWFLTTYLLTPISSADPRVDENRRLAVDSFVRAHQGRRVFMPPLDVLSNSAFSAPQFAANPRLFLTTLSGSVLAPIVDQLRGVSGGGTASGKKAKKKKKKKKKGTRPPPSSPSEGIGLVMSCWFEGHAVYRCMNGVVRNMRDQGVCGIRLVGRNKPPPLPEEWRDVPIHSFPVRTLSEVAQAADAIAGLNLDFLMYPEVGLTDTRWLATQRLARVQATSYGHPVTTGSDAIDYFVGGADIESDGSSYRERLVLLPGLGVTSDHPPPPTPRTRPLDSDDVMLISFASFNKMSAKLIATWNRLMQRVGQSGTLYLAPGAPISGCRSIMYEIGPHFMAGSVTLLQRMSRQASIDTMAEADVYLDSFPFGGYNSLIEALSVGCPVVTLESEHSYGRAPAALLRSLELPSWLIAHTPKEYVEAALRLIHNVDERMQIRAMLSRDRVLDTVCREDLASHFDAAMAWMRAQGPGNAGPPIRISADGPLDA